MSLLRLLAAGRSLVGLKETARYRAAHPKSMPKFGEVKRPVSGAASEPRSTADARQVTVAPAAAAPAAGTATAGGWMSRLFSKWRKPKLSSIPRFNKPLVQAELSLDRVKVLRNDLSDSDLEVVPAREAAPKPAARAPRQQAVAETKQAAAEKLVETN